jgi:GTPase SAR1 family protein
MSSQLHNERRRRQYRKRVHIPAVIVTHSPTDDGAINPCDQQQLSPKKQGGTDDSSRHQHWTGVEKRKVQILPGTLLVPDDEPWLFPPEPSEPPPLPTEILRFVLCGHHNAGKTSLIRKFVHRESILNDDIDGIEKKSTSLQWSVDYHKKDLTFWLNSGDKAGCARIQVYDVSGGGRKDMERKQELLRLFHKASAVFIVASAEQGFQGLELSVRRWRTWLDLFLAGNTGAAVVLLVSKCDLLMQQQGFKPPDWIHFGTKLGSLCQELRIESCHLTSCQSEHDAVETTGVEDAFLDEIRRLMKTSPQHRWEPIVFAHAPMSPTRRSTVIEATAVPIHSPLR